MKKKILGTAVIILLVFIIIILRVHLSTRAEYKKGLSKYQKKNYTEAILHFGRAIRWYLPFSQSVRDSLLRLWEIGNSADAAKNSKTALEAFREIRSSLYGVRSFYTPYPEYIQKVNPKIANLMALTVIAKDKNRDFQKVYQYHLGLLNKDNSPDPFWSIVMSLGFLGWIGCVLGFIFRAFGPKGQFYGKTALFWGGWVVFFFAAWILSMTRIHG